MKYRNKLMVFFLFMLFSYGADTSAYTFSFANMTGRDVKVKLHYVFGGLGKAKEIEAYDTHKFRFIKEKSILCLSKIIAKSFDEDKGKFIELPVPVKFIDREFFDITKDAIEKFNEGVREIGKVALLAGKEGIAIKAVIDGLTQVANAAVAMHAISFCRSRDFILILDYDEMFKIDKIYALTPPE